MVRNEEEWNEKNEGSSQLLVLTPLQSNSQIIVYVKKLTRHTLDSDVRKMKL